MDYLMKKILDKRFLYILCFMGLNVIEYLKASQTGNIWTLAVNCTGFVMAVIIFSAYPLKDFINWVNGVWTLLCFGAVVFAHIFWQQYFYLWYKWQAETAILNIWWLGILLGYLSKKIFVEKTMKLRPNFNGWIFIAMTALMTFSVSGRVWPLWYFLMFGCFYLTDYKPEDRKKLWDGMIDGCIVSFFCIQIFAYGFRPYDEIRYKGAFSNCNMMALYYLIIYLMCLYKLHILQMRNAKKGWKLFYLIGAGGMLSFQIFTLGRTAWITSVLITLLYGVLVIKKLWQKNWRQVIARGFAFVLAFIITFLPVFYSIRYLPTIMHYRVWYEGEYGIDKVHSFDPADSEKYIDLDEFMDAFLGRIMTMLRNADAKNPFVLQAYAAEQDKSEDFVVQAELLEPEWITDLGLRIRLSIYKAYAEDLTWYGNPTSAGYYRIGDSRYHSWHAQNLWLQIAYYFGIPSGVLLIVLTVNLFRTHYRRAKTKENPYTIIPFFLCVLFFFFGLMEVVWNTGQLVLILFYFVQHPQIGMVESCVAEENVVK